MTDEEFLGYVRIHSTTDRALFSGEQLTRLLRLSGSAWTVGEGWYGFRSWDAEPLIQKAEERLRLEANGVGILKGLTLTQRQALVEKAFGREEPEPYEVGATYVSLSINLGISVPRNELRDFWRWFSQERGSEWVGWRAVGADVEEEVARKFEQYLEICLEKPLPEALADVGGKP